MSEAGQRRRVLRALRQCHGIPVENTAARAGTPDVNYAEGWIELKWLRQWPKRATTVVRLPHFRLVQRRWLRDRWRVGGAAWLLLQCRREWLLFDGQTAHDHVGQVTLKELRALARARWEYGLRDRELIECLKR